MKKVIILTILVLTLIFSSCYAEVFNDLDNEPLEENIAIDLLSDISFDGNYVMLGYPDNGFGPNRSIERAQFAQIMLTVTGNVAATENVTSTSFSDVPNTHWAYKYIEAAHSLGLVYSSGETFGPEEAITYQEILYGLVNALGYKDVVESAGSYPAAWLTKADELQLTRNTTNVTASAQATRGNLATLIFNTLVTDIYNEDDTPLSRYFGFLTNTYHFHKASQNYELGKVFGVNNNTGRIAINETGYSYCPDSYVELEDVSESDLVWYRLCYIYDDGNLEESYAEVKSVVDLSELDSALVIDGNRIAEMEPEDLEDYLPLTNNEVLSIDTDDKDYKEHKDYVVYVVSLTGDVGEDIQVSSVDKVPQRGHIGVASAYVEWSRIVIDDDLGNIIVFEGPFAEDVGTENGKFITINPDENHKSKYFNDLDDEEDEIVAIIDDLYETETTSDGNRIISDYPDGSFRPNDDVTRSEYVKMLSICEGVSDPELSKQIFFDVPDSHWAANYINYQAVDHLAFGFPDGSFKPYVSVTLEDACLGALNTLGYCVALESVHCTEAELAEWLDKAEEIGLMENVESEELESAASRRDIAVILYNMLHAEKFQISKYFKDLNYVGFTSYQDNLHEKIDALYEKGIIKGVGEQEFAPYDYTTKAVYASFLLKANNIEIETGLENRFTDLKDDHWGKDIILTAVKWDLLRYSGDKITPDEILTYGDAYFGAMNSLGYKEYMKADDGIFPNSWREKARELHLTANVRRGTETGTLSDGTVWDSVDAKVQRKDVAAILYNMLQAEKKKFTITFNANGGKGSMKSVDVSYRDEYTLPENGFAAPSEKAFDKWDKGSVGSKIVITENTEVKAIWKDAPSEGSSGGSSGGGGAGGGAPAETKQYTITVKAGKGGTVSPETSKVDKGEDIRFRIKPSTGYEIADVLVDTKSVGAVKTYEFENVKANHTIEAKFNLIKVVAKDQDKDKEESKETKETTTESWKNPFNDVNSSDWFYENVKNAVEKGLFKGTTETTFEPNKNLTRGMLVTILYRYAKATDTEKATFVDVNPNEYYSAPIAWAAKNGYVNGVGENKFEPDSNITRQDLATIIYRYLKAQGKGFTGMWSFNLEYADKSQIADYAFEPVCYLTMNSVLNGKGENNFDPLGLATRAETAAIMQRIDK